MSQTRNVVKKRVLDARHVRRIGDGFSWIDRRFVRDGWIDRLSLEESALYFFLVAVADKDGLSFYSDGRIAAFLEGKPLVAGIDLARRTHAVWLTGRDLVPITRFTIPHSNEGIDKLL